MESAPAAAPPAMMIERRDSDTESVKSMFSMKSAMSRPTSPGSSATRAPKPSKSSKRTHKVKIHESAAESEAEAANKLLTRRVGELEQLLQQQQQQLAAQAESSTELQQQLAVAKDKHSALLRKNAKRLVQIATQQREIEGERNRNRLMVEEMVKQTKMLDLVMSFRDKESAKDYHEVLHENVELRERADRWKDRAELLQQERWGFVQKWREGKMAGLTLSRAPDLDAEPDAEREDDARRAEAARRRRRGDSSSSSSDGGGGGAESDSDW